MAPTPKLLAARDGSIGRLTLNQPEKRNALSLEMWDALADHLEIWAADTTLRVVVLEGAGGKAFAAGADISQFETHLSGAEIQARYEERTIRGRQALATFPKPVIACIRGHCIGAGVSLAMEADLRIATRNSAFAVPAARLGIGYRFETVAKLVSLVGPAHARMLLFTGRQFDAAEALRIGLVNQVVEDDELAGVVDELAETLTTNAPLSLRALKLALQEASRDAVERDLRDVDGAIAACLQSADYLEAKTAFLEKRKPRFTGS